MELCGVLFKNLKKEKRHRQRERKREREREREKERERERKRAAYVTSYPECCRSVTSVLASRRAGGHSVADRNRRRQAPS